MKKCFFTEKHIDIYCTYQHIFSRIILYWSQTKNEMFSRLALNFDDLFVSSQRLNPINHHE